MLAPAVNIYPVGIDLKKMRAKSLRECIEYKCPQILKSIKNKKKRAIIVLDLRNIKALGFINKKINRKGRCCNQVYTKKGVPP